MRAHYEVLAIALLTTISACRDGHHSLTGGAPRSDEQVQAEPAGIEQLKTAVDRKQHGLLADEIKLGDQIGTWSTEAFHERIKQKLQKLANAIQSDGAVNAHAWLAASFRGSDLRPQAHQLVQQFSDERLVVLRPMSDYRPKQRHAGRGGFAASLQGLLEPFDRSHPEKIHFKVYRVSLAGQRAQSEIIVDTDGVGRTGGVQQNMEWHCEWARDGTDDWRLASLQLKRFEEVHYQRPSGERLFSECTDSVLDQNESYASQLRYGTDHWRLRIEERFGVDSVALTGLAIGDVNGDGLDDIYYCELGGLPNRLFVQQPNGTALDTSSEAGVDWLDRSYGALFADLDNDSDQDLIVTVGPLLLLMENDGTGKFAIRAQLRPEPTAHSISAADYDCDGRLDLYVCSYGNSLETFADSMTPMPWHDANNGSANTLFHNEGDWTFRNVTDQVGLDVNNRRYSYASGWEDFDNDGDQDLYVANDFGRNNLYVNRVRDMGRFYDLAAEMDVEDVSPGMSADWGDFDNNGWMDIYVGNMFSSAGNRVTYQDRFGTTLGPDVIADYRRFARGNSLYRQSFRGRFEDTSLASGVTLGRWAWSSLFADLNNDGWQDLVVTNGHVTGVEPDDL